jgi:hypothetical protein
MKASLSSSADNDRGVKLWNLGGGRYLFIPAWLRRKYGLLEWLDGHAAYLCLGYFALPVKVLACILHFPIGRSLCFAAGEALWRIGLFQAFFIITGYGTFIILIILGIAYFFGLLS